MCTNQTVLSDWFTINAEPEPIRAIYLKCRGRFIVIILPRTEGGFFKTSILRSRNGHKNRIVHVNSIPIYGYILTYCAVCCVLKRLNYNSGRTITFGACVPGKCQLLI